MSHCFTKLEIFYSEDFAYGRSSITIWAVPLALITLFGPCCLPLYYYLALLLTQITIPIYLSTTIWAFLLTLITLTGLSCLPIYYYLGSPTHPNYTLWALLSTYLLLAGPFC
jgi:hypothetical protein